MSDKVIVMAIKPKYARAIFEGRKNWEFRKTPPPCGRPIYVYESAPVGKITGMIVLGLSVRGEALAVWEIVLTNTCFTQNLTGIRSTEMFEYAGGEPVSALRVIAASEFAIPVALDGRPPQNWGRYSRHAIGFVS